MRRPFAAQRASGVPPTPVLSLDEAQLVRRIECGERLIIGRDLPMSTAIRLSAIGVILIGDGQVVACTPEEIPF